LDSADVIATCLTILDFFGYDSMRVGLG